MSFLQSFAKVKVLPTAEETEIREKSTKEADKCVAEVLNQQNNPALNARHTRGSGKDWKVCFNKFT